MEIEDLKLEFFKTCHDAVQPVGIAFHHGNSHLGIATDTGCVTTGIIKALPGADTLIFEENHDEQMLKEGPYPYYLKKRIAGDQGHLSNRTAAKSLTEIVTGKNSAYCFGSLSQVNNTPNVAFNSVAATLDEAAILNSVDLTLHLVIRHTSTKK
jgi:phosphoribosyl 1,2-cyclic phosphodiesterase